MAPRTRTAKQPVHLKITIDGVPYTFDLMGSSTMDRLELFRQSGLTMPQVAEAFRQRLCTIRAAGIDDDDLVGKTHALQAGLQLRGRIERDDGDGERLARGGHL